MYIYIYIALYSAEQMYIYMPGNHNSEYDYACISSNTRHAIMFYHLIPLLNYLAPGGGCEVLFSPGLSVCVSVCLCVCPANILVFYFSAIRRDIDLKFTQDTYRVVLNSLKKLTFIGQRSRYSHITKTEP